MPLKQVSVETNSGIFTTPRSALLASEEIPHASPPVSSKPAVPPHAAAKFHSSHWATSDGQVHVARGKDREEGLADDSRRHEVRTQDSGNRARYKAPSVPASSRTLLPRKFLKRKREKEEERESIIWLTLRALTF